MKDCLYIDLYTHSHLFVDRCSTNKILCPSAMLMHETYLLLSCLFEQMVGCSVLNMLCWTMVLNSGHYDAAQRPLGDGVGGSGAVTTNKSVAVRSHIAGTVHIALLQASTIVTASTPAVKKSNRRINTSSSFY